MKNFRAISGYIAIVLIVFSIAVCSSGADAAAAGKGEGEFKTYKGAWFEIQYPADFTVRPSIKSSGGDGKYDSAFFASPDGKVEFYVFSPQWKGDAGDIDLDEKSEEMVSTETQKTKDRAVTFYTIRARNGSYTRT